MFAPLRSPTMTHTTKSIYATKGQMDPPLFEFSEFCAEPHGVTWQTPGTDSRLRPACRFSALPLFGGKQVDGLPATWGGGGGATGVVGADCAAGREGEAQSMTLKGLSL